MDESHPAKPSSYIFKVMYSVVRIDEKALLCLSVWYEQV